MDGRSGVASSLDARRGGGTHGRCPRRNGDRPGGRHGQRAGRRASASSTSCTAGSTTCARRRGRGWPTSAGRARRARRRTAASATRSRRSTRTASPSSRPSRSVSSSGGSTSTTTAAATSAASASPTPSRRQLLTDWRAPAAQAFYRATAAHPDGVVRRRHVVTRGRTVTSVEDEVLDLDLLDRGLRRAAERAVRRGRAAGRAGRGPHRPDGRHRRDDPGRAGRDHPLRAGRRARRAGRSGHRQDGRRPAPRRVTCCTRTGASSSARASCSSARAARSCATSTRCCPRSARPASSRRPSRSCTPGIQATATEDEAVAELKGRALWGSVIARAVRDRERIPAQPVHVRVDGHDLVIRPNDIASAMARARRNHKPHNQARVSFVRDMLGRLAEQYVQQLGQEVPADERGEIVEELRTTREIRVALNLAWMPITPQKLVSDLWSKPHRLASAAPQLSPQQRAMLVRERRRAVDARGRPDPRRGRGAARRGRPGRPGRGARRHRAARLRAGVRPAGARVDGQRRDGVRGDARRPVRDDRPDPDDRRARRRRPLVDLRPRGRRRGAGAVGDGLAVPAAAGPDAVADDRRRRRADHRDRRCAQLGGAAGPGAALVVAAQRADRELPDPGRGRRHRPPGGRRGAPAREPADLGPRGGRLVGGRRGSADFAAAVTERTEKLVAEVTDADGRRADRRHRGGRAARRDRRRAARRRAAPGARAPGRARPTSTRRSSCSARARPRAWSSTSSCSSSRPR